MDLSQYKSHVRNLAEKRDGTPVYNESVEHASVVVEQLFASATERVDILSGNFNSRVYGRDSVVEEAKLFLGGSAKSKLRIILENDSPEDRAVHPFFKAFRGSSNLELRIAPPNVQEMYGFHFIVMDDDSYRFEVDKTKAAAVAAFGYPEGGKNLGRIFGQLWDRCHAVESILPSH